MFFNPFQGQHLFEEHERRVRELVAMAQLADQCWQLAAGLASRTWRWGRGTLHRMRWALPSPANPSA
jgi:hypothetical protein